MDRELLDDIYEEFMDMALEEQQIQEMNYSKLSHPEAILSCWSDCTIELIDFGEYEIEKYYLLAIDRIRNRTGASNFWLADYIWRLETRIEKIENQLSKLPK